MLFGIGIDFAIYLVRRTEEDLEAQRKENCSKARRRYAQYSQAHRIYQDLPNGERRYLTDAETTEAREGAAAAVEEWCGDAP